MEERVKKLEIKLEEHGDRLHNGDTTLALIDQTLVSLKDTIDGLGDKVDRTNSAILGNGKAGLKTKVAILEWAAKITVPVVGVLVGRALWKAFA